MLCVPIGIQEAVPKGAAGWTTETVETGCCIVGGGPAGVMLGYLLARGGVPVTVLEKHKDFFRDFRGDTVHPSTLEVMYELGLLEDFLKLPHQELISVNGVFGGYYLRGGQPSARADALQVRGADAAMGFSQLSSPASAKKFPSFNLKMEHEAVGLLRRCWTDHRSTGDTRRTGRLRFEPTW